ncbi:uncharacterized protein LOC144122818 [Amblyomma americanum]
MAELVQRLFTMPDASNDGCGGAQQQNSQEPGEPRNTLPMPRESTTLCCHRQLQDAHVTLLCPCSRPSTADATRQAHTTEILSADAQPCPVSNELPSIYHRTNARSKQLSKQLSDDPRRGYDHVFADWRIFLDSKLRGCECEQRPSVDRGLIAEQMKNICSACSAACVLPMLYHLQRDVHNQGLALLLQ